MDIMHLIDRLEDMLNESSRMPLTAKLLVDEDQVYSLIDQMRVAIPEEVKKAQRIEADRDRIIALANEESNRIRELTEQEAMSRLERNSIVVNAQRKAEVILDETYIEADKIRYGADQYALQALSSLKDDMANMLEVAQNGIARLQAEVKEPAPAPAMEDTQGVLRATPKPAAEESAA